MESRKSFKDFWWSISDEGKSTLRIFMRLGVISAAGGLLSFFIGFAFIPIYMAFLFVVARFFPYWQPAYTVFLKAAGLSAAPKKLERPAIPWYFYVGIGLYSIIVLGLIIFGIILLGKYGFCGQNLLCMFLTTDH